jgi:hypothetical protein
MTREHETMKREQLTMEREDHRLQEGQRVKEYMMQHDALYIQGELAKELAKREQRRNLHEMSLADDNERFLDFHMDVMCGSFFDLDFASDDAPIQLDDAMMLMPHSDLDFGTMIEYDSRPVMYARRAEVAAERLLRENAMQL